MFHADISEFLKFARIFAIGNRCPTKKKLNIDQLGWRAYVQTLQTTPMLPSLFYSKTGMQILNLRALFSS